MAFFSLSTEIPDFLSAGECQELMDAGLKLGLKTSGLFGKDINDEIQNTTDNSQITRISDQTWIKKANISPQLWKSLYRRYGLRSLIKMVS